MMLALAAADTLAADDPGGWTAAKWGMTGAQILTAFPGQAAPLDPPDSVNHAHVQIREFDLAGAAFRVYFVPDKDDHLASVLLTPSKPPASGNEAMFQHLQELLVEKYGHPWSSTVGGRTQLQWSLKTTTITLSLAHIAGGLTFLSLGYRQRSADLDKM